MDAKSLYTNICHEEGLSALENALNKRHNMDPKTDVIITLMKHILTLNCFTFNGNIYLQTQICAMGRVAALSYAIISMGAFEEKYIYPTIERDCLFMEDILMVYF